jgi:hypothetical protein
MTNVQKYNNLRINFTNVKCVLNFFSKEGLNENIAVFLSLRYVRFRIFQDFRIFNANENERTTVKKLILKFHKDYINK